MNLIGTPGGKDFWKERHCTFGRECREYIDKVMMNRAPHPEGLKRAVSGRREQNRRKLRLNAASALRFPKRDFKLRLSWLPGYETSLVENKKNELVRRSVSLTDVRLTLPVAYSEEKN